MKFEKEIDLLDTKLMLLEEQIYNCSLLAREIIKQLHDVTELINKTK